MDLDLAQLRALSAVVAEGTFEAAARALHVTPSAISQRLKALETTTGRVLLVRSKPARATSSGEVLLRLSRQLDVLAADAVVELGGAADGTLEVTLPIAVNADSLATWVLPALAPLAQSMRFEFHREDEEHTSTLLREGRVMAAITSEATAVAGCISTPLGGMRYRPIAAPEFASRWFPDGVTPDALARAPVVVFDRNDDLQFRYLRRQSRAALHPPLHYVPASADFVSAVRLGFGWAMLPDLQVDPSMRLVELDQGGTLDIALYWQQWRLRSPSLDRVASAVREAARGQLTPIAGPAPR